MKRTKLVPVAQRNVAKTASSVVRPSSSSGITQLMFVSVVVNGIGYRSGLKLVDDW